MSDQADRAFAVTCGCCGKLVCTVPLIRAAELAVIAAHLRTCWAHDPLPADPLIHWPASYCAG